jgi:hypothetical protein
LGNAAAHDFLSSADRGGGDAHAPDPPDFAGEGARTFGDAVTDAFPTLEDLGWGDSDASDGGDSDAPDPPRAPRRSLGNAAADAFLSSADPGGGDAHAPGPPDFAGEGTRAFGDAAADGPDPPRDPGGGDDSLSSSEREWNDEDVEENSEESLQESSEEDLDDNGSSVIQYQRPGADSPRKDTPADPTGEFFPLPD